MKQIWDSIESADMSPISYFVVKILCNKIDFTRHNVLRGLREFG